MITPRSLSAGDHPALRALKTAGYELVFPAPGRTPTEDELLRAVPECVGWIAGVEPVSDAVISAATALKVISRNGSGVDNLPIAQIAKTDIQVFRAGGTNARGVAELALAQILVGFRNIVPAHEGIRRGDWPRQLGRELCDSTVGIIGLGAIGATVANLILGLGAQVYGYDPFAPDDGIVHQRFTRTDIDTVIRNADALTLHCPMPEDGTPVIGAVELQNMRDGAVLINTARAQLVDEKAVLARLDAGHLSTYATDVFENEPPDMAPLTQHPRVISTSHIGGFTASSVERSTAKTIENLLRGLEDNEG